MTKTNLKSLMASKSNEHLASRYSSSKKWFVLPGASTKKLDNESFIEFVSKVANVSVNSAKSLIVTGDVSVNGHLVTDTNHVLASNDVVRVGKAGHYLTHSMPFAFAH